MTTESSHKAYNNNMSELSTSSAELYCPIEQTWTITEEKLKEMKNANGYSRITSKSKEVLGVPHVKYHLLLSCRTTPSGNRGFWLYLKLATPKDDSRIHAKYSYIIKSEKYFTQFNHVFQKDSHGVMHGWGDEICDPDAFFDPQRKFIADGKFTVQMKGILIFNDESMPQITPTESSRLVERLWEKDDKDFKIIVGNEGNVMIHKCVLSACSDTFEAMFRSGREETITNTLKIIDFRLKTVQFAVEFFYERDIFDDMDLDDAFELIRFADKYVINDLLEKLETVITFRLSPTTVCDLTNRSIASNSIKLRQICFDFIITCSKHAIAVNNFNTLDKEFAAEIIQKTFSSD